MGDIVKNNIAILMATYNGAGYLREQLDSLLNQSCQDWVLYIHDDGSSDTTPDILNEYADIHPEKIKILTYPGQGGACRNFLSLLERVHARYYMFCDQDDVWMPDKIGLSLSAIQEVETCNPGKAIVLCTDLMVVDEKLRLIHESFNEMGKIYPHYLKSFNDYCAVNIATGCTMIFNDTAKKSTPNYNRNIRMHDAWVTLATVASGGIVITIPQKTVQYRQHRGNVIGAPDLKGRSWLAKTLDIKSNIKANIAQLRMMREFADISLPDFIGSKIKYRKLLKQIARNR